MMKNRFSSPLLAGRRLYTTIISGQYRRFSFSFTRKKNSSCSTARVGCSCLHMTTTTRTTPTTTFFGKEQAIKTGINPHVGGWSSRKYTLRSSSSFSLSSSKDIIANPSSSSLSTFTSSSMSSRLSSSSSSSPSSWPISSYTPCHLIFGANTNVGKTIVSTGLVRASLQQTPTVLHHLSNSMNKAVTHYIKPLQSGGSDREFVQKYAATLLQEESPDRQRHAQLITTTLYEFDAPVSPHWASIIENKPLSDHDLLHALHRSIMDIANINANKTSSSPHQHQHQTTFTWIETAGGVLSPAPASPNNNLPRHARINPISQSSSDSMSSSSSSTWGWTTQADLYQPLLGYVPIVLVGDGRLGGISATLAAMESLIVRGYDIAAIVLIEPYENNTTTSNIHDANHTIQHDNLGAIRAHVNRTLSIRSGNGQALFKDNLEQTIVSLPPIPQNPNEPLYEWFELDQVQQTFQQLHSYLYQSWQGHVADLESMVSTGQNIMWWPFTQHGNIPNPKEHPNRITLINSASGDDFHVLQQITTPHHTEQEEKFSPPILPQSQSNHSFPLQSTSMVDACASWWTQGLGHGDSSLALASAAAAGRYGHVLFPQNVHSPALQLSQRLLQTAGATWASRVFFSDNGSTAMEIAIKMGLRLFQHRHYPLDSSLSMEGNRNDSESTNYLAVAAQSGCYHGDTLGTMNVAEPSIWNERQHPWYEPKAMILDVPTLAYQNGSLRIDIPEGWEVDLNDHCKHQHQDHHHSHTTTKVETIAQVMDVKTRMKGQRHLYLQYKELIELQWLVYEHSGSDTSSKGHQRHIGSVVLEPIMMGAGGMKFIDPLWQRALVDVAKSKNVPVIFDEVAVGMYRFGVPSCRTILQINPDIAAYGKLLTGGLVPMAVTLASDEVFEAFLGDTAHSLLHGHSYTAHPVGCVSAVHALDAYQSIISEGEEQTQLAIPRVNGPRMQFDEEAVKELSHLPLVRSAFALGSVLAVTIEPDEDNGGYGASSRTVPMVQQLREEGIYARPLGNVIYIMVSPLTNRETCQKLTHTLYQTIEAFAKRDDTIQRCEDLVNIV